MDESIKVFKTLHILMFKICQHVETAIVTMGVELNRLLVILH